MQFLIEKYDPWEEQLREYLNRRYQSLSYAVECHSSIFLVPATLMQIFKIKNTQFFNQKRCEKYSTTPFKSTHVVNLVPRNNPFKKQIN